MRTCGNLLDFPLAVKVPDQVPLPFTPHTLSTETAIAAGVGAGGEGRCADSHEVAAWAFPVCVRHRDREGVREGGREAERKRQRQGEGRGREREKFLSHGAQPPLSHFRRSHANPSPQTSRSPIHEVPLCT